MVDWQLKAQWKQSVWRKVRTGRDVRAQAEYGAAVEVTDVRIQPKKRVWWEGTEKERTTEHDIFTTTEFETTDRVTFFDQATSSDFHMTVAAVKEHYDEYGALDYFIVSVGGQA